MDKNNPSRACHRQWTPKGRNVPDSTLPPSQSGVNWGTKTINIQINTVPSPDTKEGCYKEVLLAALSAPPFQFPPDAPFSV
jgi:hypothetical protein